MTGRRLSREVRETLEYWRTGLADLAARQGDRVAERPHQRWVAFRSAHKRRVFAEVRPSRRRIQVFILPSPRELRDPLGIARAAPRSQGWNWFRTKFMVLGNGHARAAFSLIRQSYESSERPAPRRRTRRGGRQTRLPSI